MGSIYMCGICVSGTIVDLACVSPVYNVSLGHNHIISEFLFEKGLVFFEILIHMVFGFRHRAEIYLCLGRGQKTDTFHNILNGPG